MIKKLFFLIATFIIFLPSHSNALDISGWWKKYSKTSNLIRKPIISLIKINDKKIMGFDYKVQSEESDKMTVFIDDSPEPSLFEKTGENSLLFTNQYGEKMSLELVTRDVNLSKKEVRKLFDLD